ncbi:hypothetical protein RHMOL_Rhmol08G0271800 [Rhododendron molle]|uniref:Uncharacterized protein n=1 Tax=Rhododendron molle TaxID=49168 RepID=A0ACC0MU75_RHOML|nr:hypothetical protein RHMOL_Rhmol08G0271800 [Rhododendron molle]
MVMLCFVLDLRSLPPSLLRDLKQSLLQLANFYAVWAPIGERPKFKSLSDRIGLCYLYKNRITCLDELKVAYTPRGNFNLRDFHHAVSNLPTDAFLPELNDSGALCCCDVKLASILSNEVLYSWGGHEKDLSRKVILISTCVVENPDSLMNDTLMEAADKCVSVEFLLLEQQSSHLGDLCESISNFVKHISDLENCSFRAYMPDAQGLCGLVKQWLQELKDGMDEPLQARFIFKSNLFGSLNLISCNLSASSNHIVDEFRPCQTCSCHGIPLDDEFGQPIKRASCSVTGDDLEKSDLDENSVKIGEHTVLFLPSFQNRVKLERVSQPVDLIVIERTNLGSVNEGLIMGTSFIVGPSAFHESDDIDKSELNTQLFSGLCSALHSLDQGLVCFSKCNMETMREALFHCYYLLLPSEKGLMLLRRLAGSEEVLPLPDVSHCVGSSATNEIKNSIQASLLKMPFKKGKVELFNTVYNWRMEVREYNPFLHERGFHQKLNLLVKESLQLGYYLVLSPSVFFISALKSDGVTASWPYRDQISISREGFLVAIGYGTIANAHLYASILLLAIPCEVYRSIRPILKEVTAERNSTQYDSSEDAFVPSKPTAKVVVIEEEIPHSDPTMGEEDRDSARVTEEWENLIVSEAPKISSPSCSFQPKYDRLVLSPQDSNRQLDVKTSRILERLEVPRELKRKAPLVPTKAPLVPFQPVRSTDQGTPSSQPIKPNFQRIKRRQR